MVISIRGWRCARLGTREVGRGSLSIRKSLRDRDEKNDEDTDTIFDAATDKVTLWRKSESSTLAGTVPLVASLWARL